MRTTTQRAPRRTASRIRVRYAETDQMGVVYHANYLIWCEIGRTDFIREVGTSYAELERQGLRLAVADAQARFIAPARYDDEVRIETWVERVQSRTITFGYEIVRERPAPEQRLVTASTRLIALDERGAPRTLPQDIFGAFRGVAAPTP
ncbi:MAG TPA: thioesterase family protein [Longimicrobiales bacterium]